MWNVAVEPRDSEVRCYGCGKSPAVALCHHCWRPGCARHVRPSPRWLRKTLAREASGPGLAKALAYHCADCDHRKAPAKMLARLRGRPPAATRRRERSVRRVPLLPKAVDVELTEELRGQITLGASGDKYQAVLEPVDGTLSMLLTFGGPDRERVKRRRKRLRAPDASVPWCAGRVVLPGSFGIQTGEEVTGAILPLEGDSGEYAVFRVQDPPSSSPWKYQRRYQLRTQPDIPAGPIWITPSFVSESDRHGLELDVQWVEFGPDEDDPLSLRIIDLLRLEFPVGWGEIHNWRVSGDVSGQPRATVGSLRDGRQFIELKRLTPISPEKGGAKSAHLTLAIHFSEEVNRDEEIAGRVTAEMRGTLSGVTGVTLFNALGGRRAPGKPARVRTKVDFGFQLSLTNIRYQALRVEPDRAAEDSNREGFADIFTMIPDEEAVIALTNAMSEEEYYVKHVIENPPRSGRRANELQRYWDIAGRRYLGVYPIDFHVILTGEEVHSGGIRPDRGTTKVRIVVKGAFTDEEMERHVREEYKRLRDLTHETLGRRSSAATETG
jgi:hypothetical protein